MNLCHRCRRQRPAPGRKYCFDCLGKIREESAKRYDSEKARQYQRRRREIYREKKAAGICVRCSKPATHGLYCYEHSIAAKRHSIATAERRRLSRNERGLVPEKRAEAGLCIWCGEPAVPGLRCCDRHRGIFSESGRKGYESNLKNKKNPWVNEVEAWKEKHAWSRKNSLPNG